MAYMNQDKKKEIAKRLKEKLKGYGIKWTLAVDNYSTIVMNINKGTVDFIKNYNEVADSKPNFNQNYRPDTHISVNPYCIEEHFTGLAREILSIANDCLNLNNYNNNDLMTDYYDVGHYVDINIGRWNKPYQLSEEK